MPDIFDQAEKGQGDVFDQVDMSPEASMAASRPGQTDTRKFDIPRSSSEMIGEGAEAEGAGREKIAKEHPGALASVAMAGLPLPTKGLAGVAANVVTRGAGALGGAAYGGDLAAKAGLPRWPGQIIGGATGLFAPEVIGKLSGPLISRMASILGKSAPEIATVISDETIAQKVGRNVVERAARGDPLSPKDEELLFDQVQKYYKPESGLESAASKSGKIYAGRGTSFRPTNEQIKMSGGIPPPPEPSKIRFSTDNLGVRWAHSPDSPEPVSIPKSVPTSEMEEYAAKKLADYVKTRKTTTFGK